MYDFFLQTPLLIYFNFFTKIFSKIWVAKFEVRLICQCGLYAGVYGKLNLNLKAYMYKVQISI